MTTSRYPVLKLSSVDCQTNIKKFLNKLYEGERIVFINQYSIGYKLSQDALCSAWYASGHEVHTLFVTNRANIISLSDQNIEYIGLDTELSVDQVIALKILIKKPENSKDRDYFILSNENIINYLQFILKGFILKESTPSK